MSRMYRTDEFKKNSRKPSLDLRKNINIVRKLEKNQDLSKIQETVEVIEPDQRSSYIQRNIVIPLKRKTKGHTRSIPIGYQQLEKERKAYEHFLNESDAPITKRAHHPSGKIESSDFQEENYSDDDEDIEGMIADLKQKIIKPDVQTLRTNVPDDDLPDVTYEKERSLAMKTITDEKELNETLEFLRTEYFFTAEDKLKSLEDEINKKYDEDVKQAYKERGDDLEDNLAFLQTEHETKIEHIEEIRKDIKNMSELITGRKKSVRGPKKMFGLSPISEETEIETAMKSDIRRISPPRYQSRRRSVSPSPTPKKSQLPAPPPRTKKSQLPVTSGLMQRKKPTLTQAMKAPVKLSTNALKQQFLEEQNLLRQQIKDPNELKEELDFLREEYNSKLSAIANIENIKKLIEREYEQEVAKVKQTVKSPAEAKHLLEFLQEEYKTKLYAVDEDLGLTSKFQPETGVTHARKGITKIPTQRRKVATTWKTPSMQTVKIKKNIEKNLVKLKKELKTNQEVLETVEETRAPKTKISASIIPLPHVLGIKKPENVQIMLDKARKKSYQIKKKVKSLPPKVAENLIKRGTDLIEIDLLQRENADAILHSMMLEQSGINMKGSPTDIANVLTQSDSAKVDVLGSAIEPIGSGILVKQIPTKDLNAISNLATEELSLTLKTYQFQVPSEKLVAKDVDSKKMTIPKVALSKIETDKMKYLECDVLLDSFNIENLFQARGTLMPKWFPGYYAALPHERTNLLLVYRSPSEILSKAWKRMKPKYLMES